MNIEFSTSSQGAIRLINNGHRFLKACARNGKIYWICGVSRHLKCPATITQDTKTNKFTMKKSNVHNHTGNPTVRGRPRKKRGTKRRNY